MTDRGQEMVATARAIGLALDAELTGDLSDAERATLMKALLPLIGPGPS